ncbi:MAG: ATP-binding cassette domain-containing protein [Armatimonadetes bacterium]|nr:ATP-binding cassette domain-containing protein [Armatimonadota bacterium]
MTLTVARGSFHGIIGENGAGKSTLLGVLYGLIQPDSGTLELAERPLDLRHWHPADAIRAGIALVSQHFALVPGLTGLENGMLGVERSRLGLLNRRQARTELEGLRLKLGLHAVRLDVPVERMDVAARQMLEVLKALYRGAGILLLDEPTAALTPEQARTLFTALAGLQQAGATIILVTHKLPEVMEWCDAVTVMRAGGVVFAGAVAGTDTSQLLAAMVGSQHIEAPYRDAGPQPTNAGPVLYLDGVSVRGDRGELAIRDVSLEARAGEIVALAGIQGSGERELVEAIVGLRPPCAGRILLNGVDCRRLSIHHRRQMGLAWIPEDRHREGLALDLSVSENLLMGHERDPAWGGGAILDRKRTREHAQQVVEDYAVQGAMPPDTTHVRALSGGNQQKLMVARAMEAKPSLLIAGRPERGLDYRSTAALMRRLEQCADRGAAVLLVSPPIDETLAAAARVAVLYDGSIAGLLEGEAATPERVGTLMTGGTEAPGASQRAGMVR